MKLAWFSHLPPHPSPVASRLLRALRALRELTEVVVWSAQTDLSPELRKELSPRFYSRSNVPLSELQAADLLVFHVVAGHQEPGFIGELSHHQSGLTVLHGYRPDEAALLDGAPSVFRKMHRDLDFLLESGSALGAPSDGRHPLLTWLHRSVAVVADHPKLVDRLRQARRWPVSLIALPDENASQAEFEAYARRLLEIARPISETPRRALTQRALDDTCRELATILPLDTPPHMFEPTARAISFLLE